MLLLLALHEKLLEIKGEAVAIEDMGRALEAGLTPRSWVKLFRNTEVLSHHGKTPLLQPRHIPAEHNIFVKFSC